MAQGPFNQYPRAGRGTLLAIEAAQRAKVAEKISGGELPPAPLTGRVVQLDLDQLEKLLMANYRMGTLTTNSFIVGLEPIRLRPAEQRSYLFVMNQSTTAGVLLGVGIGKPPGDLNAVPADAVLLGPNFGSYEPWVIPINEIWVRANTAATPGFLVYAA